MSGICGIVHWDGKPADAETLRTIAEAASHRGPDGVRHQAAGPVGFAYLALHVTPESVREQQPLWSGDGHVLLTADARIDNREDLERVLRNKKLLAEKDATDAELILAAYRYWGTECPAHLIGDFAFALWDDKKKRLFAARDPLGMRAFYYRVEPRRFLFATEVKQIVSAPDVPVTLFEPAVAAHLVGCFHHLEWSFYEGIAQLPPGHAVVADSSGHHVRRYWDIDPDHQIHYKDERQYVEHFLEIFKKAVCSRVRSVKPIGILLSGGVDSASVASMAGWLFRQNGRSCPELRAYSWAFETLKECDERHISDGIVRHYGLPATYVAADDHWPLSGYPAHGPDRDEPFIGVYQALLEYCMALARDEGMGLVLSGDRGDLMMGEAVYDYPGLVRTGQWGVLLDELRAISRAREISLLRCARQYLIPALPNALWPPAKAPRLRRLVGGAAGKVRSRPRSRPGWLRREFADRVGLEEIQQPDPPHFHLSGYARRQRYQIVFTPFHMRGVAWSERTQARFGLSFADAWSDRRLAEFVLAIPQRVLNKTGESKRLARESMRGIMPEEVRGSLRKIVPQPLYAKAVTDTAKDTISKLVTDSRAAELGYVDEAKLREHFENVAGGGPDHAWSWWALTLEMWLRQYWT